MLDNGTSFSPGTTALMIILIAVVLVIALNLRKKIERNEDSGDLFFRRNPLRVETDNDGDSDEEFDKDYNNGDSEYGQDYDSSGDREFEKDDVGDKSDGEV
jgi:cbb3-type cytochrome oxidase subunit 3